MMEGALALQQEMVKVQFHQHQHAEREVKECLGIYKNLKPTAQQFMNNDGSEEKRLCLKGTIKINHKGVNYHIPVEIWLDRNFPFSPPICYVDPSQDTAGTMRITKGPNVDANGLISGDMFHHWNADYGFLFLVQQLVSLFSVKPPVHSVAHREQQPQPQERQRQQQQQHHQQHQHHRPYQQQQQQQPYQSPYQSPSSASSSYVQPPPATRPPPSSSSSSSYTKPYQPTPHYTPPPIVTERPVGSTNYERSDSRVDDSVLKRCVNADLVEKTNKSLTKRIASTTTRIRGLENTKASLQQNSSKIKHNDTSLRTKISETDAALHWYETNLVLIHNSVDAMLKQEENMNVDATVIGSCILHSQLIELEAEDCALDDTIHELQRGLRGRAGDLNVMLERMRVLSENKFDVMERLRLAKETSMEVSNSN